MNDRCILSDLPPDQCAHCRGLDTPEPKPDLIVQAEIVARHDGRCGMCGEWTIREGQPLYAVREVPGTIVVWAGACCAGDRA